VDEKELAEMERAALSKGPNQNSTSLVKPPPGVRVHGWFIDAGDTQASRRARYAEQKAEAARLWRMRKICDCELGHNGLGAAIRECDCQEMNKPEA
jgi:hypothetical protein